MEEQLASTRPGAGSSPAGDAKLLITMLYLLFGEMGVGKNYVGERLANFLSCDFFDGDLVVPPEMVEKVVNFKPLTPEMIDDYVHNHLIPGIDVRFDRANPLVVAQALYFERHRQAIREYFGAEKTKLVYLPTPSVVTHMGRLYSRENGLRWAAFGLFNKFFFEKPTSDVEVIENKRNSDLFSQFERLHGRR